MHFLKKKWKENEFSTTKRGYLLGLEKRIFKKKKYFFIMKIFKRSG